MSFYFDFKWELWEPVKTQSNTILGINGTNIELYSNTVRGNSLLALWVCIECFAKKNYNFYMGEVWEILLAIGFGLFVIIGISLGIKASRENRERKSYNNYVSPIQNQSNDLENILEIYTKTFFYPGMSRKEVTEIFAIKGIKPIWNSVEVVAYLIPNATFVRNGKNMTYIGKGTDSHVWAFQFDCNNRLIQQGVMPPKE